MKTKKLLALLLVIVILVTGICSGCSSQDDIETTIVDQAGREVYVPAEAARVVSLWPEATRVLYMLDVADRIVGLDDSSITCPILTRAFPEIENISNVGSATKGTVSTEKLARLKPDIIFARTDDTEFADRIQESLGVPVVCVRMHPPPGREISFDMITIIGKCVGEKERSKEVQEYLEQQLLDITSVASKIADTERPCVYQAFAYDLLRTISYFDVIELAAGESVAKTTIEQAWYTVSLEDVLRWNPDVIILHGFGNFMPEEVFNDTQWQHIKAVHNGDVYRLTLGWAGWDPGGFVINVMQNAKVFHPNKFNFSVEKEANEIFKKVYGVDGLYSKLAQDCNLSNIDGD